MRIDWEGPVGDVFEAVAECQSILHDNRPNALEKMRAVLESPELLHAMRGVGFFPERNNADALFTLPKS